MRCLSPGGVRRGPARWPAAGASRSALTVDVLRAGLRVVEVPCELQHRVTGRDWRGQLHRAEQYRDVWLALVRRGWRPWHGAEPRPAWPATAHRRLTRAHRLCVGVALGLLLLVGLAAPNAAQPDLGPPGWVRVPRPAARTSARARSPRCCGRRTCSAAVGGVPRAAGPGGGAAHLAGPRASSRCSPC